MSCIERDLLACVVNENAIITVEIGVLRFFACA
jgi:hypothetical protein